MSNPTSGQWDRQLAELKGYQALFELLDDGACLIERLPLRPDGLRDYRYIAMNGAMQAMFGMPDLSGQSIRDHFPDEVEDWYDDYDRVLETGQAIRFERETVPQAMILEMFVARVGDRTANCLLAVMRNVTDRVLAQRHLEARELQLRLVLDNSLDGINLLDLETNRYTIVNPAQAAMTGFSMDELNGISVEEALQRVHPEDREVSLSQQQRVLSGVADTTAVEYRWQVKGGEYRWFSDRRKLIRNAAGRPIAMVGTSRDITTAKATEASLSATRIEAELSARTGQAKTEFLRAASHDLRQPIQAITLLAQALSKTGLSGKQETIVTRMQRSVRVLGETLNQLLDLSALDAGSLRANCVAVDAASCLPPLHDEFLPLADEKKLSFRLFIAKRCPALKTDAHLLMHVLRNLIGNAIKFTRHGGVLLSVRPRGDRVLIQVWDTGVGIPEDRIDQIFGAFVRLGDSGHDTPTGRGLGLSIVRRLAEVLTIGCDCHSRAGRGSVFSLALPAAPVHIGVPPVPEGPEAIVPFTLVPSKRVVVVDDDPDVAMSLKLSFEGSGLAAAAYSSAEDALASEDIAMADYVVTDFRLPGMDGLAFVSALRAMPSASLRPLKAVIITGEALPGQGGHAGAGWPILRKPATFSDVMAALQD